MKAIILFIVLQAMFSHAQESRSKTVMDGTIPVAIIDRASGIHKKNKIGLYFENTGKLYPKTLSMGPSGEYPLGSGRRYIYRLNP